MRKDIRHKYRDIRFKSGNLKAKKLLKNILILDT